MNEQKTTAAINAALIVIGGYHLPATVAFGAVVGASLFILSQKSHGTLAKAWLFAVAFLSGIFGGDSAKSFANHILAMVFPEHLNIQVNDFLAAALFSALVVIIVQRLIEWVSTVKISVKKEDKS
ncbi:MAG: putative holin [Neisseria sp.]|nr:putative holin [Neisseria sp.]